MSFRIYSADALFAADLLFEAGALLFEAAGALFADVDDVDTLLSLSKLLIKPPNPVPPFLDPP